MAGTRHDFHIETRAVKIFFFFLQGKAPKEIHAILTETLACFPPGRAKDLSVPPVQKPEPCTLTDLQLNLAIHVYIKLLRILSEKTCRKPDWTS